MKVLSLFDGMSCGQIALNKLGYNVEEYYASEIEKSSIKVTMHNFPNTKQLGDVRYLNADNLPKDIDLLIGGSPCQSFSFAGKKKGMSTKDEIEILTLEHYLELKEQNFEFEGQSYLFWEYMRILKEVNPKYFLLENVLMPDKWEKTLTNAIGVKPIEINSSLVSAQQRKRLYWTNIEGINQPEDKKITLGDIIYDDTYKVFQDDRIPPTKKLTKNYVKWDLSGKQYWSQQDRAYFKDKKMCTLPKASPANKMNIVLDYEKDIYRRIHPIEAERCQTVPDNYTNVEGVSSTKRLEMLGNGWTVDVIAHIFKNIK
jgi:site-specific DNA-cytosine methylase